MRAGAGVGGTYLDTEFMTVKTAMTRTRATSAMSSGGRISLATGSLHAEHATTSVK